MAMNNQRSSKRFLGSDCETLDSMENPHQFKNSNPIEYWEGYIDSKSKEIEKKKMRKINQLLNRLEIEKKRQSELIEEYLQFNYVINKLIYPK